MLELSKIELELKVQIDLGVGWMLFKEHEAGEFFLAVWLDDMDQFFLVAWSIVETKTKVNWKQFLECLQLCLDLKDEDFYTLISDMQKVSMLFFTKFLHSNGFFF